MAKENLRPDHPLLKLRGRRVGDYSLDVEAWSGRFVGEIYCKIRSVCPGDEP